MSTLIRSGSLATVTISFAILLQVSTAVQATPPRWIWGTARSATELTVTGTLSLPSSIRSAHLVLSSDFADVTFSCGGKTLGQVRPFGPVFDDDVSHALTQVVDGNSAGGTRERKPLKFTIVADGIPGPSAFMFSLTGALRSGESFSFTSQTSNLRLQSSQSANESGNQLRDLGPVPRPRWTRNWKPVQIDATEDYTQWKRALGNATELPPMFHLPGFQVRRLAVAGEQHGSWISMAFTTNGDLLISREDSGLVVWRKGLGPNEPSRLVPVEDKLRECRGLVFSPSGKLLANANNDKGLFRLAPSTTATPAKTSKSPVTFNSSQLVVESPGSVGHGRNDLTYDKQQRLLSIHGDAVRVAGQATWIVPRGQRFGPGDDLPSGHLIRTTETGKPWTVFATGLRNPYGIAVNEDGEYFTYDADAEHDMGAPWYRPTRLQHLISAADYGWRRVTGNWPPYFPDQPEAPPTLLDIGKGSPTSVTFGTGSRFPSAYQRALFALDWAYGRVLAAHLFARGASYVARAEVFLQGKPLNVTDIAIGPDGNMYLITGGRKTKSALYQISYNSDKDSASPQPGEQEQRRTRHALAARKLRRQLEALHDPQIAKQRSGQVELIWKNLSHDDPWIRHAARIALEQQPASRWASRALSGPKDDTQVFALLALARASIKQHRLTISNSARLIAWESLGSSAQEALLRIYELIVLYDQATSNPTPLAGQSLLSQLKLGLESNVTTVRQRALRLLSELQPSATVSQNLTSLRATTNTADKLLHLLMLRNAGRTLNNDQLRYVCRELAAAKSFSGGAGMSKFVEQIQTDTLNSLTPARQTLAKQWLATNNVTVNPEFTMAKLKLRRHVRDYQLTDFRLTSQVLSSEKRNLKRGQQVFHEALCSRCHRHRDSGSPFGPDLSAVAARFSATSLLQSILQPSAVVSEKYQQLQVQTKSGKVFVGSVVRTDYRSPTLELALNPLQPGQVTKIPKLEIATSKASRQSPMPEDLLNTFSQDEILDLLAFLLQ